VPEGEIAGEALFAVRTGKTDQIDNILWNLACNELDNEPDTGGFKDAAVALPNSMYLSNGCTRLGRPRKSSRKSSIPNLLR
jgi:hypothetical protein